MFVIISPLFDPFSSICRFFLPGRDHDYQTLNLTFATNVVKSALIIRLFPKPLKLCAVTSARVPLSLNTIQYRVTHDIEPSFPDPTRS